MQWSFLAAVLLSGCFAPFPSVIACVSTDDCRAGQVCLSGKCFQPCSRNADCGAGRVCSSEGGCILGLGAVDSFALDSVEGNGADARHVTDGVIVYGKGLDGLTSGELLAGDGTVIGTLGIRSQEPTKAEIILPPEIDGHVTPSATLQLRLTHTQRGSLVIEAPFQRGAAGPQGPPGLPGSLSASAFVSTDSNTASLISGPCASGQLMSVTGGQFGCAGVFEIEEGTAMIITGVDGERKIAVDSNQLAAGNHMHFGKQWSTVSATPTISFINRDDTPGSDPSAGLTAINSYGISGAEGNAGIHGTGIGNSSVGVIGISESANGVGIYGAATGANGRGVSGWSQTAGNNSASLAGIARQATGIGIIASNTAGGVALRTQGHSDLSEGGVLLPIQYVRGTPTSPPTEDSFSLATCPAGYVVIGGGCTGTSYLYTNMQLTVANGGACTAGAAVQGVPTSAGHTQYCCRSAGTVRAEAVCLRAN